MLIQEQTRTNFIANKINHKRRRIELNCPSTEHSIHGGDEQKLSDNGNGNDNVGVQSPNVVIQLPVEISTDNDLVIAGVKIHANIENIATDQTMDNGNRNGGFLSVAERKRNLMASSKSPECIKRLKKERFREMNELIFGKKNEEFLNSIDTVNAVLSPQSMFGMNGDEASAIASPELLEVIKKRITRVQARCQARGADGDRKQKKALKAFESYIRHGQMCGTEIEHVCGGGGGGGKPLMASGKVSASSTTTTSSTTPRPDAVLRCETITLERFMELTLAPTEKSDNEGQT